MQLEGHAYVEQSTSQGYSRGGIDARALIASESLRIKSHVGLDDLA